MRRSPVTDTVTTRIGGGRRVTVWASIAVNRFFKSVFIGIPLGRVIRGGLGSDKPDHHIGKWNFTMLDVDGGLCLVLFLKHLQSAMLRGVHSGNGSST